MNQYHKQLQQLVGARLVQVELIQNPDFSEPVPCLVVRNNGKDYALSIWADAEGNSPGWVNVRSRL